MSSTSNPSARIYTQGGGTASSSQFPSSPVSQARAPVATDVQGAFGPYPIGQVWVDITTPSSPSTYILGSYSSSLGVVTANWASTSSSAGDVNSVTGTANQITSTPTTGAVVVSIPSAFVAPGSVTATTTLTATLGAITATNGNLVLDTAGNKIVSTSVASTTTAGANSFGKVTLAGGTATVSTTAITANSIVLLTRDGIGSTGAAALGMLSVGTKSAGVSFVINSLLTADATALATTDVSSISWMIIN